MLSQGGELVVLRAKPSLEFVSDTNSKLRKERMGQQGLDRLKQKSFIRLLNDRTVKSLTFGSSCISLGRFEGDGSRTDG